MELNESTDRLYRLVQQDGVYVVELSVPRVVKSAQIGSMGDQIRQDLEGLDAPRLLIDFAGVEFVMSTFLGELIMIRDTVETTGGSMAMCSVSGPVLDVMRLMKLDEMFPIAETRQGGLDLLR